MESLSMTGLQQLCGFHSLQDLSKKPPFWFHSLQYLSKKPPFYRIGVIASGTDTFRVQIGDQWDFRRSGRVFSALIDSASLVKNSMKPLSYDLRATFTRSRSNLPLQGYVLKVGVGTTSVRTGLRQIGHSRRKRRVCSQASSGDGPSANASDSTLGEEGKAQDARSPSSSSSFWPSWNSVVKQVDWNKLIFNWRKDEPMWKVPWTGETIFQVMVLWFAAFWVMGSWVLPIAAQVAGFSRHSLTFRGQALYSLITDIAEGTVGIWILRRCLAQFFPLPHGWFPVKWQGKWLTEACWGCLLFPFVNKLSQLNLYLIPLPNLTTSYVEQSMMSRDPIATLLYAIVISVCAPVWEEVIFRGFLLPSMTRYMPLWGAIFVSALAFALAHFSMQRILPLTFLGLVMGFVFVRSKNLLASIVLHSLWNGFAFLELL